MLSVNVKSILLNNQMKQLCDSKMLYFYWKSQIFYYCTVYWSVKSCRLCTFEVLSWRSKNILGHCFTYLELPWRPFNSTVRANLVAFFCIRHNLGEKLKSIDKWTVQILLDHGIATKSLQTYQCRRQPTVARTLRGRRCQRCPCGRWVCQAEVSQG